MERVNIQTTSLEHFAVLMAKRAVERVEGLHPTATDFAKGEAALHYIMGALSGISAIGYDVQASMIGQQLVTPNLGVGFYARMKEIAAEYPKRFTVQ